MEYLPTDLPKYVKTADRSSFNNAVVEEGRVLLFSEDGKTLTAKNSDGSFTTLGGQNVQAGYVKRTNNNLYFYGASDSPQLQPTASRVVSSLYTVDTPYGPPEYPSSSGSNVIAGYIKKDNNLTRFFPVGSAQGVEVSSLRISDTGQASPDYKGGGSSSFYKCTSVTDLTLTSPASWSGYKATFSNGKYTFSETQTTGLSYTAMKPVIGGIYTEDALVKIQDLYTGMPTQGLLLYVPLRQNTASANTGQSLTPSDPSKLSYATYRGIECAKFNSTYITAATGSIPIAPMTVSIWAAPLVAQKALWCSGSSGDPMMYYSSGNDFRLYSPDTAIGHGAIGDWHHCVWSIPSSGNSTYYFDGVATGSVKTYESGTMNNIRIGYRNSDQPSWNGYLAGFRIYNRVLSAAEVAALYAEYIPTTE